MNKEKEIKNQIEEQIKNVLKWVLDDYNQDLFYREDDLKNSLYYHIKNNKNIEWYVYTEFKINEKKADLVITNKKIYNSDSKGDKIKSIEAIFELKYTKNYEKAIEDDLKKIKDYYKIKDSNKIINFKKYFLMIYEWGKNEIQKHIEKIRKSNEELINDTEIYFIIWNWTEWELWKIFDSSFN